MATMSENLIALQTAKANIKTAIESKGQDLTDVPFTQYADKINAIQTGGGESEEVFKSVLEGSVTSIKIPDGVKTLTSHLFYENTNLTSVEFPDGLENIGEYLFYKCSSLGETVSIPDSVTIIGAYAFGNCTNLKYFAFPQSLTEIGARAFYATDLIGELIFPSSVTTIGSYIFASNVNLSSVTIPATFPCDNTTSTGNAFNGCTGLTSVTLEDGLTLIGYGMFMNCTGLTSIVIPNSVTRIGTGAFQGCTGLTSIVIPNSVTEINNNAFYKCTNIIKYDFTTHTSIPALLNKNAFSEINTTCKIYVPDDLYDSWIVATNWSSWSNFIEKASMMENANYKLVETNKENNATVYLSTNSDGQYDFFISRTYSFDEITGTVSQGVVFDHGSISVKGVYYRADNDNGKLYKYVVITKPDTTDTNLEMVADVTTYSVQQV